MIGFSVSLALVMIAVCAGTEWISPFSSVSSDIDLLWNYRVPRVVLAFVIGAALAGVGSVYQSILHNPLADPFILGTSSASALGIVLSGLMLFPIDSFLSRCVGLLAAAILVAFLLIISQRDRGQSPERLILFGFSANLVLSSLLFLVLSLRSNVLGAGSIRWLFGRIPWLHMTETITLSLGVLLCLIPLIQKIDAIDAISLGDGVCRTLGFSPQKTRTMVLLCSTILVAIAVSYTGSIGFVGLVIPHFVKRCGYSIGRQSFCIQLVAGGVFLVVADALSRTLCPPLEIPIGTITNLVGGPLFLVFLWKRTFDLEKGGER